MEDDENPRDALPEILKKPIQEIVLDAAWQAGSININGSAHPFIEFLHPRHGRITFLLTPENAMRISGAFEAEYSGKDKTPS